MSLPKGKANSQAMLQSQRPPQPMQMAPRGTPPSVPIAPEEYMQRVQQYQSQQPMRPAVHPQQMQSNNNPHDMSKQHQVPTGMSGTSTAQMMYSTSQMSQQAYYSRQNPSRTQVPPVQQRNPISLTLNAQSAPQSQQAASYYAPAVPQNIISLPHIAPVGQTMYMQGGGSTYRHPYQQQYQVSSQPQPVYVTGGNAQYPYQQPAHNTTVFYQIMNRPTVATMPTGQQNLQKKERKLIRIQDPNTERDITEELVGRPSNVSTQATVGVANPREMTMTNTTPPPSRTSEVAVQFATQVAVVAAEPAVKEQHIVSASSSRSSTSSSEKTVVDSREPKLHLVNPNGTSAHVKLIEKCSESALPPMGTTGPPLPPPEIKPVGVVPCSSTPLPFPTAVVTTPAFLPAEENKLEPPEPVIEVELHQPPTYPVEQHEVAVDEPQVPQLPVVECPASVVEVPVVVVETKTAVVEDVADTVVPVAKEIAAVAAAAAIVATPALALAPEAETETVVDTVPEVDAGGDEIRPHENGEMTMQNAESDEHHAEKWDHDTKDVKKQKGKRKQLYLNRKGESKEGGDMDAFVDKDEIIPASNVPEISSLAEDLSLKEELRKVAEKNEENTKVSNDYEQNENVIPVIDQSLTKSQPVLKYNYKEDQWSPLNPEGKRQYDRAFLLQMQSQPMSLKKPEGLPDLEVIKDTVREFAAWTNKVKTFEARPTSNIGLPRNIGNVPDFTPGYVKSSTPRSVSQTPINRRPSQQGGKPEQQKGGKKSIVLTYNPQEVRLNKSENAWKPTHKTSKDVDPELVKTEDLYRRVRGILNKLTPQKFQTLVDQVNNLTINTEERLKGVIDLVFEKAIDEPSFSVAYANLCKCLAMMKVPLGNKENEFVNFRKLLLNKCQKEFEMDISDEVDRAKKLKEIEASDVDEKKKGEEELKDLERRAKRRSLGNIRFIGELFKLHMLTASIMHDCLKKLLTQEDEDSLECLCRLLTTIGKDMDNEKSKTNNKADEEKMNVYFRQMREIINKRYTTSRVRFMLQDVIELRSNNWVPRRDENNPKTLDQIHMEAEREAYEREMNLTQAVPHRRMEDKRKRSGVGSGSSGGMGEDGWNTVSSKNSGRIDPNKLKLSKLNVDDDIQLGPGGRNSVGWSRGSSGGSRTSSQEPENKSPNPSNRFHALAGDTTIDSRRVVTRNVAPSSRDSSKGRGTQMVPAGQRSGKTVTQSQKEREQAIAAVKTLTSNEMPRGQVDTSRESSVNREERKETELEQKLKGNADYSEEEVQKRAKPLLDEFLHNCDLPEAILCVSEMCAPTTIHYFVTAALSNVLERSSQARHQIGGFMHDLVKGNIMTVDHYISGLQGILSVAEDYAIDIPHIWDYLGELIAPMIQDNTLPLAFLQEAAQPCIEAGLAGNLASAVLHAVAKNLGSHKVGEMWRSSGLQWSNFLPAAVFENLGEFISTHKLEFTVNEREPVDSMLSTEQVKEGLNYLFSIKKAENEEVYDWIDAHIGEAQCREPPFVRALMTAVVESAIDSKGPTVAFDPTPFRNRCNILRKYLDHKETCELHALFALQALMHNMEHPKGILHTIFDTLYDEDIISEDAFTQWETSDDPSEQEGKGVALNSVRSFFTWLNEMENESVDES